MWPRQDGRAPGPRPGLGLGSETPGRLASAAGLPRTLSRRGLRPGPYLVAPGPGASSSRGRRGPARGEDRRGHQGARERRPVRLPRFRQSQELNIPPLRPAPMRKTVTATAPPTSRRGTTGPPCPRPARPCPGRCSYARASRARGGARASRVCTPRATNRPRALRQAAAARGRSAGATGPSVCWGERAQSFCPLCTFPSFKQVSTNYPVNSVLIRKHVL